MDTEPKTQLQTTQHSGFLDSSKGGGEIDTTGIEMSVSNHFKTSPVPVHNSSENIMFQNFKYSENQNTIQAYEEFLKNYPTGELAEKARSKIVKIYFSQAKAKNPISTGPINFDQELKQANTIEEFLTLLCNNPFEERKIIPKIEEKSKNNPDILYQSICEVEKQLVDKIKIEGPSKRLVLKTEKPGFSDGTVILTDQNLETTKSYLGADGNFIYLLRFRPYPVWALMNRSPCATGIRTFSNDPEPDWLISRFIGKIPMGKDITVVGEGAFPYMLSFAYIKNIGFVYIRGKGKVFMNKGKEIKLGYQ